MKQGTLTSGYKYYARKVIVSAAGRVKTNKIEKQDGAVC
jgi:hypothetical protein